MIWRKTVEVEKWSNLSTARVVARDRGIWTKIDMWPLMRGQ